MKSLIKSKSLIAVLVLALILVPCMFLLTACGDEPENTEITSVEVSNYTELVNALKGDKNIVKLTENINLTSALVVNRTVTLDLNGKTISNTADLWDTTTHTYALITVREGGNLTVTGNGTMDAKENDCFVFNVLDGAKLTVENGTFKGNISALQVQEGSAYVKGGSWSIKQLTTSPANKEYDFMLNCIDANYQEGTAKIIVTGGTFAHFNPAQNLAESNLPNYTNFVLEGYESNLVAGSTTDYVVTKTA